MFLLRRFLALSYATLSRLTDLCLMQAGMAGTIVVERAKTFVVQAAGGEGEHNRTTQHDTTSGLSVTILAPKNSPSLCSSSDYSGCVPRRPVSS